jgi:hypothetical protein
MKELKCSTCEGYFVRCVFDEHIVDCEGEIEKCHNCGYTCMAKHMKKHILYCYQKSQYQELGSFQGSFFPTSEFLGDFK